ncbi:MAG: PEP-CTERM sorting domain-containing protein [Rugosibacter sp.]|nr:PEP-CTERM sorting domain-containing protein [Rugosibacter sp.]
MKLKMKLMAAAVALAASAGANAAMDNMLNSGNSSLAFIALDSTGTPISMMMDLDFNVDSFLSSTALTSTAGNTIQWNFNTNTLTINNVVQAGAQTNWNGAMSTFAGAAQAAETKWAVIAGDGKTNGTPGDVRYLTTSNTPLATLQGQTKSNLSLMIGVDSLFNAHNLLQTTSNGSTATAGAAYVGDGAAFGLAGKWENRFNGVAWADEGALNTNEFWMLDSNNGTSSTRALVTSYAGDFTYNAGVLTYSVAAIPEPSEYALMLAGLGMIGFMARRRLNNRA